MIYTVNMPAQQVELSLSERATLRDRLIVLVQTHSIVEHVETIYDEMLIIKACDIKIGEHELQIVQTTAISLDDNTQRGYCTEYYKCLEFFERSHVELKADSLDELITKIEQEYLG